MKTFLQTALRSRGCFKEITIKTLFRGNKKCSRVNNNESDFTLSVSTEADNHCSSPAMRMKRLLVLLCAVVLLSNVSGQCSCFNCEKRDVYKPI